MLRQRVCFGMGPLTLAASVVLSAACGGTASHEGTSAWPTTPSPAISAGPAAEETSRASVRDVVTFTLDNGAFRFMSQNGELTGIYRGFATAPTSGRPRVTMTLEVTGGSRALAGATGTLVGDGGGAVVTDGDFVLSVEGVLYTATAPSGLRFRTTVVGKTTLPLTCSHRNRRISRLHGEGTIPTVGRAQVELESEIVEAHCF